MKEKTLVVLKPDTIQRGLMGKIIERFENVGLKVVGMKMIHVNEEFAKQHYPLEEEWAKNVYEKNKKKYEEKGEKSPFKDHMEMGKTIQQRCSDFICESPVVALVIQGPNAIEIVRKMVGTTEPLQSPPGTIRGDFASLEAYNISDKIGRVLRNLIHASDSIDNANREIGLWFSESELFDYEKELDKHFKLK